MSSPSKAKAARKVARVMREFKEGELESSSGQKVKSRKQAIAIGLSEARRSAGAKSVAPRKSDAPRK
jgi:mevalonate pyrophosphate decarboxylase